MRISLSASLSVAGFLLAMSAAPVAAQTFGSGNPDNGVGPFGLDVTTTGTIGTVAESFVTPSGSPVLQSFTFYLGDFIGGSDLRVQASVFQLAVDRVVNSALFTSTVRTGSSNGGGFDPITFSGVNLLLTPGTTYALLLRASSTSADGATNFVGSTTGNTFSLGQLLLSTGSTDAQLHAAGAFVPSTADVYGLDAAVQATFGPAAVTATPEPATFTLLATGLLGLGGVVRRRRRAAH